MQRYEKDADLKKILKTLIDENAAMHRQLGNRKRPSSFACDLATPQAKRSRAVTFDDTKFERDMEEALDRSRAEAGLSASSGSRRSSEASVPPPPEPESKKDLEEGEPEVTSSTHRKEYMALTRRMESLDPEKFPEVSALWKGTRAEPC